MRSMSWPMAAVAIALIGMLAFAATVIPGEVMSRQDEPEEEVVAEEAVDVEESPNESCMRMWERVKYDLDAYQQVLEQTAYEIGIDQMSPGEWRNRQGIMIQVFEVTSDGIGRNLALLGLACADLSATQVA